jgi:excisionase family DNA binding protein
MILPSIPGNDEDAGWLSVQAAAWQLAVVPKTIYRLINNDELPAYRVSRMIRIRAEDLDRYIQSQRIQPGELAHLCTPHPAPDPDTRDTTSD